MNQPAKLSKTGITGWRRVTASDLRTSTENSRSLPIARGLTEICAAIYPLWLGRGVSRIVSWRVRKTQQAIVPAHKIVIVCHLSCFLGVAFLFLGDPAFQVGVVLIREIVKILHQLVVLTAKALYP